MRTWRRLGMILHREYRLRSMRQSFDGLVVQVDVGDLDFLTGGAQGLSLNCIAVILRTDRDLASEV